MWNLDSYTTPNIAKIEPNEGELVRDYCMRVMIETQRWSTSLNASYLRECGHFHEVTTADSHNEEIEEWLFEFAREGSYYCTNLFGAGGAVWFFNDTETAAMFKLAFGKF